MTIHERKLETPGQYHRDRTLFLYEATSRYRISSAYAALYRICIYIRVLQDSSSRARTIQCLEYESCWTLRNSCWSTPLIYYIVIQRHFTFCCTTPSSSPTLMYIGSSETSTFGAPFYFFNLPFQTVVPQPPAAQVNSCHHLHLLRSSLRLQNRNSSQLQVLLCYSSAFHQPRSTSPPSTCFYILIDATTFTPKKNGSACLCNCNHSSRFLVCCPTFPRATNSIHHPPSDWHDFQTACHRFGQE